ncbi:MAG: LysR family transcriptional regulator [Oscillospiraceae bacterium]|jgi:N-terminal domain of molybdenum-binding protein|nr:LysR family transcriptional regulator [Oscillospiraceae bacterium]MBQ6159426.1 LysR family transcriptional regulator [Oscillospiraceae bacterium]MBQ6160094.1 LysR family transcriptional regulator [Oscillospiraceae bacterium]
MKNDLHPGLTIRLFTDQKCFGPGVAELLHRVETEHSLRAAAGAMEMAYSKAWRIVRTAEEALGFRLLHSSTGGKNGGGATLTPEARQFLEAYDRFCEELNAQADSLFRSCFAFYQ